ncbi:MAG TPA: CPBP family intramembrane glutamic endopeptidase [Terriglobales bacterium]|nr:CPBP family intramembrane glutamic endopeptidase [Terriglobales bacterium]
MQTRPRLLPVVLATATFFPVLFVVRRLIDRFVHLPGPGHLGRNLAGEVVLLLITVAIVTWTGWWRQTGLLGPWRQRWWTVLLLVWLALMLLIGLPVLLQQSSARPLFPLLPVLALAAMIGFCEETLTRGVILYGLSRHGPLIAGLISAAIFGLLHSFNYFEGVPVSFVVSQVTTAALLGLLFAGLRVRMLVLWPMIVAHAAVDVPGLLGGYPLDVPAMSPIAIVVSIWELMPFGMLGLGLLLWEHLNGRNPLLDR